MPTIIIFGIFILSILIMLIGSIIFLYLSDKRLNQQYYDWYKEELIALQEDKKYREDKRFKMYKDLLKDILKNSTDKKLKRKVEALLEEYHEYIMDLYNWN